MAGLSTSVRTKTLAKGAGLLAAGALAGVVAGGALSASATTTSTPTPTTSASPDGSTGTPDGRGPGGHCGDRRGPDPVRGDEQSVASDVAEQITAAAEEAVPGGTVYRVETDAGDAAFEAHMTDAAGTPVTVKLDEDLAVVEVQDGMGKGDPGPADDGATSSGTSSSTAPSA